MNKEFIDTATIKLKPDGQKRFTEGMKHLLCENFNFDNISVFDASSMSYGRICVAIVNTLIGKFNPTRHRRLFSGNIIVIKNGSSLVFKDKTAPVMKKFLTKTRIRVRAKEKPVKDFMDARGVQGFFLPTIRGMLPKNDLYRKVLKYCIYFI